MVKNKQNQLGAALKKSKAVAKKNALNSSQSSAGIHVSSTDGGDATHSLASYLEGSSLDDFLASAVLSNRQFEAEKERVVILEETFVDKRNIAETEAILPDMNFFDLKLPRRPLWDDTTTPDELNVREKEAFLNWRRDIALMEEASTELSVTPFEKNLEVWRQLWRVIERSDIVIQIVDARNPLFYRSSDLEKYVKEVGSDKNVLLLVNKSDFLTEEQRNSWAKYFKKKDISFVFFSAKLAQEELDRSHHENLELDQIEKECEGITEGESDEEESDEDKEEEGVDQNKTAEIETKPSNNEASLLNRNQLLDYMSSLAKKRCNDEDIPCIFGMTGFPNVGKSSVINALLGACTAMHTKQRVAVGATPGKTKHFQTMVLSEKITLCDCPGLVFPSFVSSKAEMICHGVLPLSQLRDHISPTKVLCQRIPKRILESIYHIHILTSTKWTPRDPVDPYAFLEAYASSRGFMTAGRGIPDASRAARIVLKDYVNGKLLYCHPPADADENTLNLFNPFLWEGKNLNASEKLDDQTIKTELKSNLHQLSGSMTVYELMDEPTNEKNAVSKRLKKHGRKGRKGRDKNPYDDDSVFQQSQTGAFISQGKKNKKKEFKRVTMPHHPTYQSGGSC